MVDTSINGLRESFLKYFESKGHLRLPSFSLVPVGDPTLLIINAGMAPMKPYFKGEAKPPRERIATCQKCVRVGDIERVGKTARHLTFFEMLGNFSFGDYYKKMAIIWAWEFVTKVLGIPEDIIYATVHTDDDEAEKFWIQETGIKPERVSRLSENFWGPVGDTGPCGPCSEVLVDQGEEFGCGNADCKPGCDCDRYLELWNLVFTGLYKNEKGEFENLPKQCIDTGLGMDRLAAYMQKKQNVFETDAFEKIMSKLFEICGKKLGDDPRNDVFIKVIADHVRSVVFMASDGITPSNEGRGYVMRRLLRRSVRLAGILGFGATSLSSLVAPVVNSFGSIYPELIDRQGYASSIISAEEENFSKTLNQGTALLESLLENIEKKGEKILPGKDLFSLYDTYGFPKELTEEIASEKGFSIDHQGFDKAFKQQQERSRQDLKEKLGTAGEEMDLSGLQTVFAGYSALQEKVAVKAIFAGGTRVDSVNEGQEASVVFDKTCFYGESGGQVGDSGIFYGGNSAGFIIDTKKTPANVPIHRLLVKGGVLRTGDELIVHVDEVRRSAIKRHHTATHLLQSALRHVLGSHVGQMGSLVDEKRLRFDFSHHQAMTESEIWMVEWTVNNWIVDNFSVQSEVMPISQALKKGALAFFGEKYEDQVRMISVSGFSLELCGGTHVQRTGDIGCFKIISEGAIGMGIRRIEAECGLASLLRFEEQEKILKEASSLANTDTSGLVSSIAKMKDENDRLEKELKKIKKNQLIERAREFAEGARNTIDKIKSGSLGSTSIGGVAEGFSGSAVITKSNHPFVEARLKDFGREELRDVADMILSEIKSGVITLGTKINGKYALVVRLSDDLIKTGLSADKLIKEVTKKVAGSGGGKPGFAQGGLRDDSDESYKDFESELVKLL